MAVLTLHIAHGDMEVPRLRALGYDHVVPWREALADGPVRPRSIDLVNLRRDFVERAYSSSAEEYDIAIVGVLEQIMSGTWKEVVLHFDKDLFCCVNFMFLVSVLGSVPRLVWDVGAAPFVLSTMDRAYITSCWRAYASADPRMLEDLILQSPPSLIALTDALRAHLVRFPSTQSGYGRPQELVLEILDRGLTETEDLVQAFIALDQNVYGWGDVQIIRERKLASAIQAGHATMDLGGLTQTITGPHWQWDPLKQKLRWSEE